ncbi:MAG: hypothetical protein KDK99_18115 [Verrucomicrobiales bacterium]|nr:hypothetical protein [Verrucomicrobiales bacterium]
MSRSIAVVATSSPAVHNFRDFGEEVYRAVRDECRIDISEIDSARDRFSIYEIPPNSKGEIVQRIKKLARKYSIEAEIRNED